MAPARCPVCGAVHASCGPAGIDPAIDVAPPATVPRRPQRTEDPTVGHLKLYDVAQGGRTVRLRLSEADAKLYGAAAVAYSPPTVRQVGHADDAEDRAKRAVDPANKARTAGENKAR